MDPRQLQRWVIALATQAYLNRRNILRILALVASITNALAFIPQILKIIETHSVGDLSLAMYVVFSIVGATVLSHLYLEKNWHLGLGVGLTLTFCLITEWLIIYLSDEVAPIGTLALVCFISVFGIILLIIFYLKALPALWKILVRFLRALWTRS